MKSIIQPHEEEDLEIQFILKTIHNIWMTRPDQNITS